MLQFLTDIVLVAPGMALLETPRDWHATICNALLAIISLVFRTLCTHSNLLVIHSLGYKFPSFTPPTYKSMGFGRCAHPRKKVVLAAFLIVIHQTVILFKMHFQQHA